MSFPMFQLSPWRVFSIDTCLCAHESKLVRMSIRINRGSSLFKNQITIEQVAKFGAPFSSTYKILKSDWFSWISILSTYKSEPLTLYSSRYLWPVKTTCCLIQRTKWKSVFFTKYEMFDIWTHNESIGRSPVCILFSLWRDVHGMTSENCHSASFSSNKFSGFVLLLPEMTDFLSDLLEEIGASSYQFNQAEICTLIVPPKLLDCLFLVNCFIRNLLATIYWGDRLMRPKMMTPHQVALL